jgi:hypothetical protein
MFIQVIQGKVKDAGLLERQIESWRRDIKPGAKGYLGSTSGITPDGRGINLARFESEAAAKANSERLEQGRWWSETAEAFAGDPTFYNCGEVDTMFGGGSNDARFVQIIQARAKDPDQMRARRAEMEKRLRERRPDILGMVIAWHGDGGFTQAVYFTSEAEARGGEKETEQDQLRQEFMSLMEGPPTFFDLTRPDLD